MNRSSYLQFHIIIIILILNATFAFAQSEPASQASTPPPPPPPVYGWKQQLRGMLTLTQSSYTNWVQGGNNSVAYTATIDGKIINDEPMTNWTTSYKFAYGNADLSGVGSRITDDIIDLESVYSYKLDTLLNPYVSANLITQFGPGYNYNDTGHATEVSKFFDPGYITQGAGMGFWPLRQLKERIGIAAREIVTSEFTQYANVVGEPQTNKVRTEGGFQSTSELNWKIDTNIILSMNLSLFAPFNTLNQIVVYSENTVTMRVSKYISVGFNLELINERDISPRTQIEEGLGLNLNYVLL